MSVFEKLFAVFRGRTPAKDAQLEADRGRQLSGPASAQSAEDQAGVRQRMEDELDAQREHRAHPDAAPQ